MRVLELGGNGEKCARRNGGSVFVVSWGSSMMKAGEKMDLRFDQKQSLHTVTATNDQD